MQMTASLSDLMVLWTWIGRLLNLEGTGGRRCWTVLVCLGEYFDMLLRTAPAGHPLSPAPLISSHQIIM